MKAYLAFFRSLLTHTDVAIAIGQSSDETYPHCDIQRVLKESLSVGAEVEDNGNSAGRLDSSRRNVQVTRGHLQPKRRSHEHQY